MKQHITYERRRAVKDHGEQSEAAGIGSRVFPLLTPSEAMLTVARKSSTRVFAKGNYSARVLRSSKRLYLPENDGNEMDGLDLKRKGKNFEIVYSRKRQRLNLSSSNGAGGDKDPRFKFVFSRKQKKEKSEVVSEDFFFNWKFLDSVGIDKDEILTGFSDSLVLVVILEVLCDDVLLEFRRFFISVVSMMRKGRISLHYLTAFLLSQPMGGVFPRNGIHFLPLAGRNSMFLRGNSISKFGTCKIYSTRESLPLISLNFDALPSYFMSLHLVFFLRSQFLPHALSTYLRDLNIKPNKETQCDDCVTHVQVDTHSVSVSPAVVETSAVVAQRKSIARSSKLRKLQRRRSFFRQSRTHKLSSLRCHSTLHVRDVETFDEPFVSAIDKATSFSPGFHSRFMKVAKKSHGEQMKEIKAALSDIKQNIDSVQCNANILVTADDRCWREEGAEVLLELSSSGDWCLAVKIEGNLRYFHKPQDMKYTFNRFNHAYMWIGEDGWRLEFCEKWDWLTFKELHAECRQRNNHPKEDISVKVIPVPVFKDVPSYDDDSVSSFARPEQYIRMKHDDEILRATVSEVPYYDMDSGDEEWLKQHNSSDSIIQNSNSSCLLEGSFERMIFTFEKDAYYSSSNVTSLEGEPNNHEELETKDVLADVYEYWSKKKKQKRAPLVRVFQGLSVRKPQLMQRQVLRKKRSLKRMRSQVGREKPACGFDSKAKEEAKAETLQEVDDAEDARRRSMEAAVPLRQRAQLLMENADLAVYKSLMAVRISEAIESMPTEAVSSILDFLPEI